jgi:hypothetical protein
VTTNYALDLNAGLTQVLADGSSAYLYGNGRIAQYQTAMQYFGADALNGSTISPSDGAKGTVNPERCNSVRSKRGIKLSPQIEQFPN